MAVNNATVLIKQSEEEVSRELCSQIEERANYHIEKDGHFKIGVSGGSVFSFLKKGLTSIKSDWSKWYIFFCDECVILENNTKPLYELYSEMFQELGILIPDGNIIKVNTDLPASEAARDYISKLALHFPPDSVPVFHCLVLGMGPDGHVCSLFPNHNLLSETSVWVASITDSPKPPLSRITLTFPVINNAKCCIFALSGSSKADIVKRVFGGENLPATMVQPASGDLFWVIDEAAASFLPK